MNKSDIIVSKKWCKAHGINKFVIKELKRTKLLGEAYMYILSFAALKVRWPDIILDELYRAVDIECYYGNLVYDGTGRIISGGSIEKGLLEFVWKDKKLIKIIVDEDRMLLHRVYDHDYVKLEASVSDEQQPNTVTLRVINYADDFTITNTYVQNNFSYMKFLENNYPDELPYSPNVVTLSEESKKLIINLQVCMLLDVPENFLKIIIGNGLLNNTAYVIITTLQQRGYDYGMLRAIAMYIDDAALCLASDELTYEVNDEGKVRKVISKATKSVVYENHFYKGHVVKRISEVGEVFYEAKWNDNSVENIVSIANGGNYEIIKVDNKYPQPVVTINQTDFYAEQLSESRH